MIEIRVWKSAQPQTFYSTQKQTPEQVDDQISIVVAVKRHPSDQRTLPTQFFKLPKESSVVQGSLGVDSTHLKEDQRKIQQSLQQQKSTLSAVNHELAQIKDTKTDTSYITTITQELLEIEEKQVHDTISSLEGTLSTKAQTFEIINKRPDYIVTLPSRKPGDKFFLNEEAILSEIATLKRQGQHGEDAHTVKQCILKGISDEVKKALMNQGAPKSFFEVSEETPSSILIWADQCSKYLSNLNRSLVETEEQAQGRRFQR